MQVSSDRHSQRARRRLSILVAALTLASGRLLAQAAIAPPSVVPAEWQRFALRLANVSESPISAVRMGIPETVQVLGVGSAGDWVARNTPASDSAPRLIDWTGGRLVPGGFQEFTFFGRVAADARPGSELVFPVHIERADGTTFDWSPGGGADALIISIRGTTTVSPGAAFALAGAALGLAVLALGIALFRSHPRLGADP